MSLRVRVPTSLEQLLMLRLSSGLCSLKRGEALRHGGQHLAQRAQRGLLHQGIAVLQASCDDALQTKTGIHIRGKQPGTEGSMHVDLVSGVHHGCAISWCSGT